MIFISLVNLRVVQKSEQVLNCIHDLSSDDKTLSPLIKKVSCTCTFLNHFREAKQQ